MDIVSIVLRRPIKLLVRKLKSACYTGVLEMKEDSVMKTNGAQKDKFSIGENQCVWMKAGVVHCKTCENTFDCTSCTFDKEISGKSALNPTHIVSWREVMRQPQLHKECRHMLTGRVLFKLCSHNYECKDCAYDQFLYEYDQMLCDKELMAHTTHLIKVAA
jgi:hypothetical protein